MIKSIRDFFKNKDECKNLEKTIKAYKGVFEFIEENKLSFAYYDMSNISIVKNGKKLVPQGWYMMKGKYCTLGNPPEKVYETFIDCILGENNG